jgi:hypothetical protein
MLQYAAMMAMSVQALLRRRELGSGSHAVALLGLA